MGLEALLGGATFVACNQDRVFPAENGRWLPGCGAFVGAIAAAAGRPPDWVAGKPSVEFLDHVSRLTSVGPAEILVAGDSVEADIAMANAYGAVGALVTRDCWDAKDGITPDITCASLGELLDALTQIEQ
jgi:ribonucleotide monophosphatase NagD (HAD superfamily)